MSLLETLLRPDGEEKKMGPRSVVIEAANLLQVGEFQLLQLAYRDWYGQNLPEALISRLFTAYMMENEVPSWARHYARTVLDKDRRHVLDDTDPAYHRFDAEYRTNTPNGVRKFLMAVAILAFLMVSALLAATLATQESATMFPPYLDTSDIPDDAARAGAP